MQVEWRYKHISTREFGWQNGKQYEWILPKSIEHENFYPPIQNTIFEYLKKEKIKPHTGINNLKSSWVQCANLYFPIRDDNSLRSLFAEFLRKHINDQIQEVIDIELEYELEGKLHPSVLLGEKGGGRGFGQTSPDFAVIVKLNNGGRGLLCIENKLVEHSFYRCSARTTENKENRSANPDPSRCMNIQTVLNNINDVCHQIKWGRQYWPILAPVIDKAAFEELTRCPAATAGYQLFRQQALCEGIAQSGDFDLVYSCVAFDERNDTLRHSLQTTGIKDFSVGWEKLFQGKSKFGTFTHQDWVNWVRENSSDIHNEWLRYNAERYEY